MNNLKPIDGVFADLEAPDPPPDLRRRALIAARSAMADSPVPANLWSRLWSHRGLRVAWATTVAALLIAHAVISLAPSTYAVDHFSQPDSRFAGAVNDAELFELIDLPRVAADPYRSLDG